jgi:hypothetical protein
MKPTRIRRAAQADHMLGLRAARLWVKRDTARLSNAQQHALVIDPDGTGYSLPGVYSPPVEWHNALYGCGRYTYYKACLRRYSKNRVIRVFGSYRYRKVEDFGQALGRGHRLEQEWKAACGDIAAAMNLGLMTDAGMRRAEKRKRKILPQRPVKFYGRGVGMVSLSGLAEEQVREKLEALLEEVISEK